VTSVESTAPDGPPHGGLYVSNGRPKPGPQRWRLGPPEQHCGGYPERHKHTGRRLIKGRSERGAKRASRKGANKHNPRKPAGPAAAKEIAIGPERIAGEVPAERALAIALEAR